MVISTTSEAIRRGFNFLQGRRGAEDSGVHRTAGRLGHKRRAACKTSLDCRYGLERQAGHGRRHHQVSGFSPILLEPRHPVSPRVSSLRATGYRQNIAFVCHCGRGKKTPIRGLDLDGQSLTKRSQYKLELYCMSLSTSGMSDAMLEHLFMDLPERCVVLMVSEM